MKTDFFNKHLPYERILPADGMSLADEIAAGIEIYLAALPVAWDSVVASHVAEGRPLPLSILARREDFLSGRITAGDLDAMVEDNDRREFARLDHE